MQIFLRPNKPDEHGRYTCSDGSELNYYEFSQLKQAGKLTLIHQGAVHDAWVYNDSGASDDELFQWAGEAKADLERTIQHFCRIVRMGGVPIPEVAALDTNLDTWAAYMQTRIQRVKNTITNLQNHTKMSNKDSAYHAEIHNLTDHRLMPLRVELGTMTRNVKALLQIGNVLIAPVDEAKDMDIEPLNAVIARYPEYADLAKAAIRKIRAANAPTPDNVIKLRLIPGGYNGTGGRYCLEEVAA
jgi:hypothetical protein